MGQGRDTVTPANCKLLCIVKENLNSYKEEDTNRISICIAFSLNSLYQFSTQIENSGRGIVMNFILKAVSEEMSMTWCSGHSESTRYHFSIKYIPDSVRYLYF